MFRWILPIAIVLTFVAFHLIVSRASLSRCASSCCKLSDVLGVLHEIGLCKSEFIRALTIG